MSEPYNQAVALNRFGYYELAEKPSVDELNRYYSQKYYQESKGHYSKSYSAEEIRFFNNKLEQKLHVLSRFLPASAGPRSLLDIGAGEGWALDFFRRKGWRCTGVDYSDVGCRNHNPESAGDLRIGDIPQLIAGFLSEGRTFDVVWLDNVLEHLLDPLASLKNFAGLVKPGGQLVLEVPNDFSKLQESLLAKKLIGRKFWIAVPDHVSYFNRDGLVALCKEAGWTTRFIMGDFPIDFNLFNPATNYIEDRSTGRACHIARVEIENLLHAVSLEKTVELFRQYADLGLGRQIIGFFQRTGAELSQ